MTLKDTFASRRQNEQKYLVKQCAKQGCLYLGHGPNSYSYHVWLVEEARNTLNQNARYNSEVLRPNNLTSSNTRIWERDKFGPMGKLIDFETQKESRLGMKLFKDINPNLPLAEQIQKKYDRPQDLFNEFAVVNLADEISIYSQGTSTPAAKTVNTDRYTLDQSHQSYFSRRQISHNRMLVLGDRQKEIQLAHMFDNNILVIDGGPGTGKTSTMIQRLKLLLSSTFYSDEEYKDSDFSNGTNLDRLKHIWNTFLSDKADKSNTWMFFSPTIQLNNFLKSSLSGEGLKYIEDSTKVWVNRSKRILTGYCIELARDLYHFIDNTTLQHEQDDEYFTTSPQSLYQSFEIKLLDQFKEDHTAAQEELSRLEKAVGIDHPKNFESSPSSLESIFRHSGLACYQTFDDIDQNSQKSKDFVRHLSDKLTEELYENCLGIFQNERKCALYAQIETAPAENLRNRILTRTILFRFVEQNNSEIFNEILGSESPIIKKYRALCSLLGQTRLSDFKKGFCGTDKKNCDRNATSEEKKQETSYCENNPFKDKFEDPTRTTMDIFLQKAAETTGYPLSAEVYHTLFYAVKGFLSRKSSDETYGAWSNYVTQKTEAELAAVTEKFIWALIKRFVNYDSKIIGHDFQPSWFVTNEISKAWGDFANIEKARKDLYKKEDIDTLFGTTLKNVYGTFRQEHGFTGDLKIQELSFLIFAANTLAQKLYKTNNKLFLQLSAQNPVLDAYNSAARIIIGIDESTDFTPVELAAMASLGHPEYNCVTLAGDQMQAFNEKGITDWEQLKDGVFFNPCATMDLKISYRQSHTLLEMAKKIYKRALKKNAPYESYVTLDREAAPLLIKSDNPDEKKQWLVNRINTITKEKGYLPATAIFYPSENPRDIDYFVDDLQGMGISAESCFSATDSKIIVYPLSLVKGLEFEVAFFYDLDTIKSSEMQQRYLYVGLSRATFYLGATSSSSWDGDLANDFETDIVKANWPYLEKEAFKKEPAPVSRVEVPQNIVKTAPTPQNKAPDTHADELIRPMDWAAAHGVKSDLVVYLLQRKRVRVYTKLTKVPAAEYEKIIDAVEEEKRNAAARDRNLRKTSRKSSEQRATLTRTIRGEKITFK